MCHCTLEDGRNSIALDRVHDHQPCTAHVQEPLVQIKVVWQKRNVGKGVVTMWQQVPVGGEVAINNRF